MARKRKRTRGGFLGIPLLMGALGSMGLMGGGGGGGNKTLQKKKKKKK